MNIKKIIREELGNDFDFIDNKVNLDGIKFKETNYNGTVDDKIIYTIKDDGTKDYVNVEWYGETGKHSMVDYNRDEIIDYFKEGSWIIVM